MRLDRRERPYPARLTAEHLSLCADIGEHADPEYDPEYKGNCARHTVTLVRLDRAPITWKYRGSGMVLDRPYARAVAGVAGLIPGMGGG